MLWKAFVVVIACTSCISMYSQLVAVSNEPVKELKITSDVTTSVSGPRFGKGSCDSTRRLYARIAEVQASGSNVKPMRSFTADGRPEKRFDAPNADEGRDSFVARDGTVFEMTYGPDSVTHILRHSVSGAVVSIVDLDMKGVVPRYFVAFPGGGYFVTGLTGAMFHAPFDGIFDSGGKLRRTVTIPEDESAKVHAEAGDAAYLVHGNSQAAGNVYVSYGSAALGLDGNVYLMRYGHSAVIHMISPQGDLLRTLNVDSDQRDDSLFAMTMVPSDGSLAVGFGRWRAPGVVVKVVTTDGNNVATYASEDTRLNGSALACIDSGTFLFMAPDRNGMEHIYRTSGR